MNAMEQSLCDKMIFARLFKTLSHLNDQGVSSCSQEFVCGPSQATPPLFLSLRHIFISLSHCHTRFQVGFFHSFLRDYHNFAYTAHIQWLPRSFFGRQASEPFVDRSTTSTAKVKNEWTYTSTPLYVCMVWT
jgi:hypothetical protein